MSLVEPGIGELNEGSLHRQLKERYRTAGDRAEVPVGGFVVDLVRADGTFVEVQTGSFGAMGRKLDALLDEHRILVVHPIALETVLCREGRTPRRSPKRGSMHEIFAELASWPTLIDHPNLTLEVVGCRVSLEQVADPGVRRGRGGWRTVDRRLDEVLESRRFAVAHDLLALMPDGLEREFTTADLARRCGVSRRLAQSMAFCLAQLCLVDPVERRRDGVRYRLVT